MTVSFRAPLITLVLAAAAACGPRQVEVRTAPTTSTAVEQSVRITNSLSQAVNVYVTPSSGSEIFLRQVPANSVETVPVAGVPSGTSVTFKAVTVDGSRTYQSRSTTLSGMFVWGLP